MKNTSHHKRALYENVWKHNMEHSLLKTFRWSKWRAVSMIGGCTWEKDPDADSKLTQTMHDITAQVGIPIAVIDGNDDWNAPGYQHPDAVAQAAGVKLIARFHTGSSGITKSGIVISKRDLNKFMRKYWELYPNVSLADNIRINWL